MKAFLALSLSLFSIACFAENKVTVFVELSPAGSFQAVSQKAKGNILKAGDSFTADKISLSIESLKTGIDLRDEHTWKHMNASKHPKATLSDVKGSGGKATGTLEVNGVKKPVNITYKVVGQEINSTFTVKASDFALAKATYLGVGVNDDIKVEVKHAFKNK
jgi:polyisoprenoid-binding protein YceI